MNSRILIVEDEPQIADFLVRGLSEEGYRVELATDGREGRDFLEHDSWDLVILDWWLPVEDGIGLLKRFRRTNQRTPVLFLTARDAVSERIEGLDSGADDYLCKPFAFDELLARIRSLLRRPDQKKSLSLEFADVTADLASHRASRAGHALELTAKEFALLCMFLRFPQTVLTRTRIFDTVWGDYYDGVSNTIEVHVKELRRKLERLGPRLIQTRRGSGYILEHPSGQDSIEADIL